MKKILSLVLLFATILSTLLFAVSCKDVPADDTTEVFYASAADKLAEDKQMVLAFSNDAYELYFGKKTGEVYVKNLANGNITYTNPFDLSDMETPGALSRAQSQFIVNFNYNGHTSSVLSDQKNASKFSYRAEDNGITVTYIFEESISRDILPYAIKAETMMEKVLAPLQQQAAATLAEDIRKTGLFSEEEFNKYMDYPAFCKASPNSFSTVGFFGKEIIWGNLKAFKTWYDAVIGLYRQKYLDLPSSEKANLPSPSTLKAPSNDYFIIETMYTLASAYSATDIFGTKKPSEWEFFEDVISLYPYLQETATHPIYRETYYCNSMFVLDLTATPRVLANVERILQTVLPELTHADVFAYEEEVQYTSDFSSDTAFTLSLTYLINDNTLSLSIPWNSFVGNTSYVLNSVSLLPSYANYDASTYTFEVENQPRGAAIDIPLT